MKLPEPHGHGDCPDCGRRERAIGFYEASSRRLREAVETFDHEIEQYAEDGGEWITGYRIPTGPLHRLLAAARGEAVPLTEALAQYSGSENIAGQ